MPADEAQSSQEDGVDLEALARLFTIPRAPAQGLVKALIDTFFHVEVTGVENIPAEGGALIICNHTDLIDVPIQAVHSPRRIIYLGKAELFEPDKAISQFLFQEGSPLNAPGLGVVRGAIEATLATIGAAHRIQLTEWGGQPIVRNFRGETAKAAVEYYKDLEDFMVGLLEQGHMLSIYPEGTRTNTGVMAPFKALAAKIAIRAGVPIVPSGISGAFKFLTLESFLSGRMFRTAIHYNIGKPFQPDEFPPGDLKKSSKELTALLEKQVYALTQHPERREQSRGRARVL